MWRIRKANGVHCRISIATSVRKAVPPLEERRARSRPEVEVVGDRPDELVQDQAVHQADQRRRDHHRQHQDRHQPGPHRRSGARKIARKSPTAHSITAVISAEAEREPAARQNSGSASAST